MASLRFASLATTALAAAGFVAALAASSANAGVFLQASTGSGNVPVLNGSNAFPGVDPVTDPQGNGLYTIDLAIAAGNRVVGPNTLNFQGLVMSQSYNPATGPLSNINSAIGDSTTVQIRNVSGPAVTLTLVVTFDAYNYPGADPKSWISTIATTRPNGGATFGSSEVVKDAGGNVVSSVIHSTLTAPGSETITKSLSTGGAFSIVQTLVINLPTGAIANIQKSDTITVPEPASLALLGAGLLGLAAVRRRKAA